MTTGHSITISPTEARVEVHLDGQLLASTDRAVLLDETGIPTRFYLPKDDVRMDLLTATSFHTTCPFKGEASYWSATIGESTHDGVVWAYESPLPGATEIEGLLSFYPDRTQLTVDGQIVPA